MPKGKKGPRELSLDSSLEEWGKAIEEAWGEKEKEPPKHSEKESAIRMMLDLSDEDFSDAMDELEMLRPNGRKKVSSGKT